MRGRLIAVILALVLVCSLAGVGTMAWFTSTAASNSNTFQSGRLEINITEGGEIPKPLFKTSYYGTVDADSGWDVGFWYPGKIVDDERSLTIKNTGTMPLRICGVSANISNFRKNTEVYDFGNPNNNNQEMIDTYNEFTDKMIIRIKRGKALCFEGSLKALAASVQAITPYYRLNVGQAYEFDFEAEMLTSAGNTAQGASATVDLVMHATQDNNEAVTQLLGNN